MEKEALAPSEFQRGRKILYKFTFFNVLSFLLISSNIIILYAIKLKAGSFFIGLLSSFLQLSYIFLLLGRLLIKRMGVVKLMGRFWLLRYLLMLPVFVTPFLYYKGLNFYALLILAIAVLGFNVSRGIAITSWNPIMGEFAGKKDRGFFLSRIQIITHIVTILTSIVIALFIGENAPPERFTIFIGFGIIAGFVACHYIFKLPEPIESDRGISTDFLKNTLESLKEKAFRKFIAFFFVSSLSLAMLTPFIIVFFKNIYGNSDNEIILFTIAGGLGALAMALINGFMIDRIGSKPFILMYSIVATLVTIPLIIAPSGLKRENILIFAALIFFFSYMANNGLFNTSQVYFYSFIKPEERLNLGVVYFLSMGISGTIGSLLGGSLLEMLQTYFINNKVLPFQIYFAIIMLLFILNSLLILTLKDTGIYSVRNALAIIFSPRDLRAIGLLNKLDKSKNLSEEKSIIQALGSSGSIVTREEILLRLKSPSFLIRAEALNALHGLPLDSRIEKVLLSEVKNHHFTTAYIAAELIGEKRLKSGIKVLRQALYSKDYFLAGKSMVALAKLDDRESIDSIIHIVEVTSNPRLIIHGAWALQIFHHKDAIGPLIMKMEKKGSPFLRDEVIMSISRILNFFEDFYPIYTTFLESAHEGIELLKDMANLNTLKDSEKSELEEICNLMSRDTTLFNERTKKILNRLLKGNSENSYLNYFQKGLSNKRIGKLERFKFLVAFICIKLSIYENN